MSSGDIYQISVGDGPRSTMTFRKDQVIEIAGREITITKIIESRNHFFLFGKMRYTLYAKNEKGEEFEYRYFEDMPIAVTYEIPK